MVSLRSPVTVPSSIGPLPLDQRLGKLHDPRVFCETQPATYCQCVTLLRRTSPIPSIDLGNIAEMSLTEQPFQDKIRCLDCRPKSRRYSELDERDETPVRARPFLVGMDPETTISLLPRTESLHNGPVRNLFSGRQNFLRVGMSIEDLCESEITNRRVSRFQKPVDRGVFDVHWLRHIQPCNPHVFEITVSHCSERDF